MRVCDRLSSRRFLVVLGTLSLLFILPAARPARACTAFLQEDLIAGKNYDWRLDQGLIVVASDKGVRISQGMPMLSQIPDVRLDLLARYPETTCAK